MYQAYANLALLLIFFEYRNGGYGGCWGFIITKDKENYALFRIRHSIWAYRQRITTTTTHAQLSPQIKYNLCRLITCKYFSNKLQKN